MDPSLYRSIAPQSNFDPVESRLDSTLKSYRDNLQTKTDIRLFLFDKQQIKLFKNIRNVKSCVRN